MLSVAYLVNALSMGGVQKYMVELCNRLNRKQFAPMLIGFRKDRTILDFLKREDVPVWTLDKKGGNDWRIPHRIAQICREQKVDVLHSNNWGTLVETCLAHQLARHTQWLHVQHGLEYNIRKEWPLYKRWCQGVAARWALGRANAVAAVSQATRDFMTHAWGVRNAQVQVIYNGVELNPHLADWNLRRTKRQELGMPENALVIISVGRLDSVKNYPCLIQAFALLRERLPEVRLLLVGDGDDAGRVHTAIHKNRVENSVSCIGNRTDVSELLVASDLFGLASLSEGVSLSILEAMSAGLPVVATEVGGNPELIDEAVGALVPAENPIALSQTLYQFLSSAERRGQCSKAARMRVEQHFTQERMVAQYESLYMQLVSGIRY